MTNVYLVGEQPVCLFDLDGVLAAHHGEEGRPLGGPVGTVRPYTAPRHGAKQTSHWQHKLVQV